MWRTAPPLMLIPPPARYLPANWIALGGAKSVVMSMKSPRALFICLLLVGPVLPARTAYAGQATNIYGIFGYDPSSGDDPRPYLNHIYAAGPGWVTTSVIVGSDPNNVQNIGSSDLTWLSNDHPGNTIVCRLNNGYFPNGTIQICGGNSLV